MRDRNQENANDFHRIHHPHLMTISCMCVCVHFAGSVVHISDIKIYHIGPIGPGCLVRDVRCIHACVCVFQKAVVVMTSHSGNLTPLYSPFHSFDCGMHKSRMVNPSFIKLGICVTLLYLTFA